MRFSIELNHGPGERVSGTVTDDRGVVSPFAGWLELLRLLEPPAASGEMGSGALPPGRAPLPQEGLE